VGQALPESERASIRRENLRDFISIFIAVPWQLALFLAGMLLVMKRWDQFALVSGGLALLSVALYFLWFRHLRGEKV
jgi:SSS family solute:Na+ symporter